MSDNPIMEPADVFYGKPASSEPSAPTEEAAVTNVEDQAPQPENELEPPAKAEESEAEGGEEESQYLDLDGEEVSLEDVRKWKNGHLMQSDYTKKTTAHAEEVKAWTAEREAERENLNKSKAEVTEMTDMLSVLVAEDEAIDWAELKEDDPERYIELKEKADKRKAALEKVKAERETPADDPALIQTETKKLFAANPAWIDKDGNLTDTYKQETQLLSEYALKSGFSPEEFSQLTRSHYLNTILKAAKYDQLQEKGQKIKEQREKVPIVTKPKAKQNNQPRNMADIFYGPQT